MKLKQVELKEDSGSTIIAWIDKDYAITGKRFTLNLGEGIRSPKMSVIQVWDLEKDEADIKQQQIFGRSFGGSIK